MKLKKRQLMLEVCIWLFAEVLLGYLGLDNLADYSEYLKERNVVAVLSSH
ncbi:hypothetical protein IQ254_25805 [Nodosilinea sp. LEGE 07088]|nr:hypothetical protein [Nodosilinea sp. LEGE 07088]MBE9140574.1 hypothetical protein [Nodosilinea sp. LEGE 07088]